MVSTSLINLYNEFIKVIDNRRDPFDTISVVVPSKKIEQWFKAHYLKNNKNGILMNVNFLTLNNYLSSFLESDKKFINKNIVKLMFIKYFLDIKDLTSLPDIIKSYLSDNNLKSIKIYDLSSRLADLYISYDLDDILNESINEDNLYKDINKILSDFGFISYSKFLETPIEYKDNYYFFGFSNYSKIEDKILSKLRNTHPEVFFDLDIDDVKNFKYNLVEIKSTPSKIREVENLHSNISKLLLNNKDLMLSDFLVLAPNISEYRPIIASVFKQDNIEFIDLPYTICYKDENSNHLYKALKVLFDIYSNKSFTRLDLISLIENRYIKKTRNITDEDIDSIKTTILNANIYRNKEDGTYDDWDLLIKRLLTSKIILKSDDINSYLTIDNKDYASFTSLSLDDELIVKIVSLIKDLKEIILLNDENKKIEYEYLINILDKFFSIKENDIETNIQYKKVLNEIDNYRLLDINLDETNFKILFYDLLDVASSNRFISGEMFTKGVTFLDLDDKSILNSKYIFILGCDSKSLEFNKVKFELDKRDDLELLNKVKENKNLFLLQCNNTEHLYISYVNQDLKSGEEFFLSPLIYEIKQDIDEDKLKEDAMSLDENRDYADLFTRREKENKEYYDQLLKEEEDK